LSFFRMFFRPSTSAPTTRLALATLLLATATLAARAQQAGGRTLELNVNRHNPALAFYERQGFAQHREEDIAIGPYWMNDFVLRKDL
ncbi:MAG: GNAT family N-acetyltransferase, partial [Hymenobacter sp.]